ncbi:MAG: hypothetical protein JNK15_06260 [Planctomycetes bacterium]|nr:hypothetical protein [Planctomycetota bacterium]
MTTMFIPLFALVAGIGLLTIVPQDPQPSVKTVDKAPSVAAAELVKKWDPADLKKMDWLCGTWVSEDGGRTTEEHWRPLQGTTILGSSHTFDATTTHFFEHLRITARGGSIAYLAMPGGKPAVAFLLVTLDDGVMVFENPKHDHPQRIRYERTKDGVTATISLLDGTKAQSFVFKKKA